MADVVAGYIECHGVKTAGFSGFSDAYGENGYLVFCAVAYAHDLKLLSNERYSRTETSVTGRVLKVVSSNPGAVLLGGSGTPAVLPAKSPKERGLQGQDLSGSRRCQR
jgi:branched-chain amino acid transport system substrate-binding protein